MTSKCCFRCKTEKPHSEFGANKRTKDGLQVYCKPCAREALAEYRKKHPEKIREYQAKYEANNREFVLESRKRRNAKQKDNIQKWNEVNKDHVLAYKRAWKKANPHIAREEQLRRRATRLQATPKWDKELTALVTKEAAHLAMIREKATGFEWHVDHVVPLRGDTVCGLHVWNNLDVIPAQDNLKKNNKWQNSE